MYHTLFSSTGIRYSRISGPVAQWPIDRQWCPECPCAPQGLPAEQERSFPSAYSFLLDSCSLFRCGCAWFSDTLTCTLFDGWHPSFLAEAATRTEEAKAKLHPCRIPFTPRALRRKTGNMGSLLLIKLY